MADGDFARREELKAIRELFDERFKSHERLDEERHENIDFRLQEVMKTVNDLPGKKELENQTLILSTRIVNLEQKADEKARSIKWFIGLVSPIIFGVVMFVLTMIAKALKLL